MKLAYGVKQKTKIATLLFCIMACTILIRTLEDRNVKNLNSAFSSLYTDRLVPAMHLFHITEHLHAKRSLLSNAFRIEDQSALPAKLKGQLSNHNSSIDSLLHKYGKTYLVQAEKEQLRKLKLTLASNKSVERQVLVASGQNDPSLAKVMFEERGRSEFHATLSNLTTLMEIQNQVGEELTKDSALMMSDNKIYSSLQMALAVVIGILIVGLVFASKAAMTTTEKFHLN